MGHVIHSPIFFRVTSLALGQSYDCLSASEEIMKNMGKIDSYLYLNTTNMTKRELCA